MNHTKH